MIKIDYMLRKQQISGHYFYTSFNAPVSPVPGNVLADATRAQLQRAVESLVGGDVQVSVETADRISPERSGKRPTIKPSAVA